jgi:hypothetical protein
MELVMAETPRTLDELFIEIDQIMRANMTACRRLGEEDMRDEVIAWLALSGYPELRDQFIKDFPSP